MGWRTTAAGPPTTTPRTTGAKAERATQGEERTDENAESQQLKTEPRTDAPTRVHADRAKQHAAERSTKREQPVASASGHHPCGPSNQVGNRDPRLLGTEGHANQSMRSKVNLQAGLCKQRRAARADEIRRDSDDARSSAIGDVGSPQSAHARAGTSKRPRLFRRRQ